MPTPRRTIRGKCHCGGTEFEVTVAPASLTSCTCTFCAKRGALWAYYRPEQFKLLSSHNSVAYTCSPESHRHYHCGVCGCCTHSDTPVWVDFQPVPDQRQVPVNARLFEDFDLAGVPVQVIDGRNLW